MPKIDPKMEAAADSAWFGVPFPSITMAPAAPTPAARAHPHTGDSRPVWALKNPVSRWLSKRAAASSSSDALLALATIYGAKMATMPWLPDPPEDMTGYGSPARRASAAAAVAALISHSKSPGTPFSLKVYPMPRPTGLDRPYSDIFRFISTPSSR